MKRHYMVHHPSELVESVHAYKLLDYAADHLIIAFGSMYMVIFFVIYPLCALLLPSQFQALVFFLSSGWVQLWALPLLNYAQNKADKQRQAKADVDHYALTHIAQQIDLLIELQRTGAKKSE